MKRAAARTRIFVMSFALILFLLALSTVIAAGISTNIAFAASADESQEYVILKDAVGGDICENYSYVGTFDTVFGQILRFQQVCDGKTVEGAQITVTVDKGGNVLSRDGRFVDIPHFKAPAVSLADAQISLQCAENCDVLASEDVYFYDGTQVFDAYKLTAENLKTYYVSKHTGDILYSEASPCIVKTNVDAFGKAVDIDVAYENGNFLLKDEGRKIYIIDAKGETISGAPDATYLSDIFSSSSGDDFAPLAVTVYDNMTKTYDFYTKQENIGTSLFGMTGKNNNDDPSDDYSLYVFLNFASNSPDSDENKNAFFSPKTSVLGCIFIGNGVEIPGELYMQGKAFDVIAHEYQHGVTQSVAGFNYVGESGALDEAFSDIFGALIEGNDPSDLNSAFWTIGENGVYSDGSSQNYIRSLKGGTVGQCYNMGEKFSCRIHTGLRPEHTSDGNCDHNGVHYNSTIISHVQYELSSRAPEFFTRERIGTLWFTTLMKLAPMSTFLDFSNAFVNSATELAYPEDIKQDIFDSLSAVGLISNSYNSIRFLNAADGSVIYFSLINNSLNAFNYDSVKAIIESDIVTPTCTYKFKELQNADKTTFPLENFDNITDDINVYVVYDTYCTATFEDTQGNVILKKEYLKGSKISRPENISDFINFDKYAFFGWRYPDMAEKEFISLDNFIIAQNVTFVPTVIIRTYTVNFYTDDTLITIMKLNYGDIIPLPDNTTVNAKHTGYILEGWYLDPQLSVKVDNNITLSGDIDLYAKWVRDEHYYQSRITIIIISCIVIACIIFIPLIIFLTTHHRKLR